MMAEHEHVHGPAVSERKPDAHADMVDMSLCEADVILGRIKNLLKDKYDISHAILQAEADNCPNNSLIRT